MEAQPAGTALRVIDWTGDGLRLLDQRRLPEREDYLTVTTTAQVAEAIRDMVVRGAPAIGITAAYGAVLAAREAAHGGRPFTEGLRLLRGARPTAVNLGWALDRAEERAGRVDADTEQRLLELADKLLAEEVAANLTMGRIGAAAIEQGSAVLTHCNTGTLATGGQGTALGVIRSAWGEGRLRSVYADETRPWLQGSRLTAWELARDGIPVTVICEGAAAALMAGGGLQWVIVGADRIAANGDVANKIGTYSLAVLARHHGLRFMVVAPSSTIDPAAPDGSAIPVEQRSGDEVLACGGRRVAPPDTGAWNPVFDVTPAELVDAIVTERGLSLGRDGHRAQIERWLTGNSGP